MKTYNDLPNDQLVQLARLAVDDPDREWVVDRTRGGYISLRSGTAEVFFWPEDGDIFPEVHIGDRTRPYTLNHFWQIVALCKSWGVDYSPKAS